MCGQPDQIIGTSEVLPTAESSGIAAAESTTDGADDVWTSEVKSPVVEDVDEVAAAHNAKRGSLEFHEDLLHIKPYVKLMRLLANTVLCSAHNS